MHIEVNIPYKVKLNSPVFVTIFWIILLGFAKKIEAIFTINAARIETIKITGIKFLNFNLVFCFVIILQK